jgi:Protein of unknown function (DUF805)
MAGLSWVCLLTGFRNDNILLLIVPIIIGPVVLWMALAVMTKRYHDRGKPAWWILIAFIPVVGGIWQLIELGLLHGTDGANDYGPDPTHSFNVADDIERMRNQAGYKSAASAGITGMPVAAGMMPHRRSPYIDGRSVFGKRV